MKSLVICKVQAGFPSPADDYLEKPLSLDEYLIEDPPATFFVKVVGHSMLGVGICEDDIAVVNRSKKPRHGDIVIAIKDNSFLIKELVIRNHQLHLKSHSQDFPIQILNENNNDSIWGVVIGIVRKL